MIPNAKKLHYGATLFPPLCWLPLLLTAVQRLQTWFTIANLQRFFNINQVSKEKVENFC